MAKSEVYKSTTLGEIPLSFTGRHLLQNLREAVTEMVADIKKGVNLDADRWEPVSLARGKQAQYMSKLEGKERLQTDMLRDFTTPKGAGVIEGLMRAQSVSVMHLPPIPAGYELVIEDNVVTIAPIEPLDE